MKKIWTVPLKGLCFSRGAKKCPHISVQPGEPVGGAGQQMQKRRLPGGGELGAGL